MKTIRPFYFFFIVVMLLSGFKNPDEKNTAINKTRFEVIFNQNVSFTELALIQAHCQANGIALTYKKIEYDDKGLLKSLSFKVNCNDGFAGSASTDVLTKNSRFGFCRDYQQNAKTPFATGTIDKDETLPSAN